MKYENLKFDIEDNIGRITLNRPNSANAITIPLVKELLDVAIRCESGEKVRVLILQGEGPIFCAGGDLKFMTEQKNLRAAISEMIGILHDGRFGYNQKAGRYPQNCQRVSHF